MSQLQAKQLLREAYDETFGIFSHQRQAALEMNIRDPHKKRPLASVALHPAEEWAGDNIELDRVLRGFADNNVGEFFKISAIEFLELPVEYAERFMRISKAILSRKAKDAEAQNHAIETEANRGGKR